VFNHPRYSKGSRYISLLITSGLLLSTFSQMACSTMDSNVKPPHLLSRRSSPFVDVANRVTAARTESTTAYSRTPVTLKLYRRNSSAKSHSFPVAVPFPTVQEEDEDSTITDEELKFKYVHNPAREAARSRDWAEEVARRQENIRELRDRKIRLEQAQAVASRARKASAKPSYSLLTSGERKLNSDDLDFISDLHASVVWRLWHVDLTPEVFASERLLATRLHLVLMRHGKQNIPVPPIVAVSKSHHLMHTFSTRHMMDKDRPGVQSLPQLVAKSLLRQSQPKKRIRAAVAAQKMLSVDHKPSPLSGEPITFL